MDLSNSDLGLSNNSDDLDEVWLSSKCEDLEQIDRIDNAAIVRSVDN